MVAAESSIFEVVLSQHAERTRVSAMQSVKRLPIVYLSGVGLDNAVTVAVPRRI